MSNRSCQGQLGMFMWSNRSGGEQLQPAHERMSWLYWCGRCSELEVSVAGTLCLACEKPRKRAAATRRAVRKVIANNPANKPSRSRGRS